MGGGDPQREFVETDLLTTLIVMGSVPEETCGDGIPSGAAREATELRGIAVPKSGLVDR
ncbi:hypothetical protein J3A64_000211 [Pseudarthrobacter sp. PvP004]|jgi:hypothetical protein|nr:hypothetical protein [Pseudarthrobacter sp. PvP004]